MAMNHLFANQQHLDRVKRLTDLFEDYPVEMRAAMTLFIELVSIALIVSTDEEAMAMMVIMDVGENHDHLDEQNRLRQLHRMAIDVLKRHQRSLRVGEIETVEEDVIVVALPMPQPLPPRAEGDDDRARPCTFCGSYRLVAVEYRGTSEDYDGTSEWECSDCGRREGRWTHRELAKGELEPRYGLPLRHRN